ncbi:hypothetical protein LNP74_11310 [Klebsiella pneumoniae subsp. pneumoniae]|nr:hypothetical protein [Klebsiella pneumoniae subsp. pneumoniae]
MKNTRRLTTFCPHRRVDSSLPRAARWRRGTTRRYRRCSLRPTTGMRNPHDELAMESLQKVLSVDANNTQALYLMALWSQQGGDMQAAAQWRARLAKAAPDSPGLQDLDNAKKMSQVPQGPAQPGPPAGARRQYLRGAGDLAQYVQWQYAACRAGGGILPDHGQRQIALSAGYQRAAPVRGAASAGERPAGGVGQSVNLAGRDSPGRDRPARADGQRQ